MFCSSLAFQGTHSAARRATLPETDGFKLAGSEKVTGRVGRIAPNRADAPRDSTIRQNARLDDSTIRRFGNS